MTTHTPMLARYLPSDTFRFLQKGDTGARTITTGGGETNAVIAKSLGVLPDHNVKLFIGVEGPHDISFLKVISRMFRDGGEDVPDLDGLEMSGDIIFFPFGGSNLALWASRLKHLNRPEYHICDRDHPPPAQPKYFDYMAEVNARENCRAVVTAKREMENYLHQDAIYEAYAQNGINIALAGPFDDFDDVPLLLAQAVHAASGGAHWNTLTDDRRADKIKKAKRQLNGAILQKMSIQRLAQSDPNDELRTWLSDIKQMIVELGE